MPMLSRSSLGVGYPFRYIKKRPPTRGGLLLCTHTYRFKTRLNRVYLVDVEQYKYDIFIVKFYLKNHKESKQRYNLTTKNTNSQGDAHYDCDGWRVLTTCLRIMLEMQEQYPNMSGGFIGANRLDELKSDTTRYRVWRQAALTFFSPEKYMHYGNPEASAYFIAYKDSPVPNLVDRASEMFEEIYQNTEGLFPNSGSAQSG